MKPNLLVITNGFPDIRSKRYNCHFVYEYTNAVKEYFEKIYVISPQPYLPKLLSHFSPLRAYSKLSNFRDYTIDNITIFYPTFLTLPFNYFRSNNYESFANLVNNTIKKNGLKFDLIHAHFLNTSGQAAVIVNKKFKKPLILSTHGGDIYDWPFNNQKNLSLAINALNNFDHITAPSLYLKDSIRKISPRLENKISLTSNFIDPKKFKVIPKNRCRQNLGLPIDKTIIINVANLITAKGQIDLINAVKDLPNSLTILIGEGESRAILEAKISDLKLQNKVLLAGSIPNDKLPLWYNAADLFVFPSYKESFGIVQIESLACGTPIVAYANEGSKEIVSKEYGILSPIGDVNKLRVNINNALTTNWNRAQISSSIQSKYTQKKFTKILYGIYNLLLSNDKPQYSIFSNNSAGSTIAK